MADLTIQTDAVIHTANNLRTLNKQMRDGMGDVQAAVSRLDAGWEGSAATNAVRKFNEMKADFSDSRYDVLENYVKFLLHQVGEGYEAAEQTNTSLADAFK